MNALVVAVSALLLLGCDAGGSPDRAVEEREGATPGGVEDGVENSEAVNAWTIMRAGKSRDDLVVAITEFEATFGSGYYNVKWWWGNWLWTHGYLEEATAVLEDAVGIRASGQGEYLSQDSSDRPGPIDWYYRSLGMRHEEQGAYLDAIAFYEDALEAADEWSQPEGEVMLRMADCYALLGNDDAARRVREQADRFEAKGERSEAILRELSALGYAR